MTFGLKSDNLTFCLFSHPSILLCAPLSNQYHCRYIGVKIELYVCLVIYLFINIYTCMCVNHMSVYKGTDSRSSQTFVFRIYHCQSGHSVLKKRVCQEVIFHGPTELIYLIRYLPRFYVSYIEPLEHYNSLFLHDFFCLTTLILFLPLFLC